MRQRSATRGLKAFSFLALVVFSSAIGAAEMRTRDLSGTVTDHQHEPLSGAVVQVENGVTMGIVSYITTRDGRYSFKRLDGDTDYRVWVNFRGNRSKVRKLNRFDSNRPKTVNFILILH